MKRAILLLNAIILSSLINAQNNVQWRGENRNGIYNETGLMKKWPTAGPKLLWHFDKLGEGFSSAAVTTDRVYITGMKDSTGFAYSFDLDGNLVWSTEYGMEWTESWPGVRTTPVINEGKLYIESGFGKVVCMDASSGKIIWTVNLMIEYDGLNINWGFTENLLIDGDKLFCTPGGKVANVLALNKNTGKLIWKSKGKGEKSAYGSPALINLPGMKIVVVMTERSILGIDASNGILLWSHPQTNDWSVHPNTPVFENGMLYCTSGYGRGGVMLQVSADGKSIKEIWRNATLDSRMGGTIMKDGKIYGTGDNTRSLQCIDQNTGKLLFDTINFAPGNIISAENLLYLYSEGGLVGLVEPKESGFSILGSFKVLYGTNQHWAHLVIKNKRLYVRHGTSLMVYDIAAN